jgi:hypothetical protein
VALQNLLAESKQSRRVRILRLDLPRWPRDRAGQFRRLLLRLYAGLRRLLILFFFVN